MGRWTNENAYDPIIRTMVDSVARSEGAWPIPTPNAIAAVKAIIASESAFNPKAVRGEPQIGDASIGLMQILYSTAQGLGYSDDSGPQGLFSPDVNIFFGTKLIHQLLRHRGGDLAAAFSAYNGGYRPALALGVRATKPGRLCLQWKPDAPTTGRTLDQHCARIYSYKVGEFGNQPYVNKALHNYEYFFASAAGSPPQPNRAQD